MYAFGAQGKNGDNTAAEPNADDDKVEFAKWHAWTAVKGTSKKEAEDKFIELAKQVLGY